MFFTRLALRQASSHCQQLTENKLFYGGGAQIRRGGICTRGPRFVRLICSFYLNRWRILRIGKKVLLPFDLICVTSWANIWFVGNLSKYLSGKVMCSKWKMSKTHEWSNIVLPIIIPIVYIERYVYNIYGICRIWGSVKKVQFWQKRLETWRSKCSAH